MTQPSFTWEIDLDGMVGMFCRAETIDGVIREGKITGVQHFDFTVDGEIHRLPTKFELNDDSADTLDFYRLKTLDLR